MTAKMMEGSSLAEVLAKALSEPLDDCLLCAKPATEQFTLTFYESRVIIPINTCQRCARRIEKSPAVRDWIEEVALRYIELAAAEGASC